MYKILIAEDEPLVRKGIVTLIDFNSLEISQVFEAANGEIAWEIVQKENPDIILTDINMPHMDGITFSKLVKKFNPDTLIIFLTGYDYFEYAVSALKLGATDFIMKPITKKEIEVIITEAVNQLKDKEVSFDLNDIMSSNNCNVIATEWRDEIKNKIDEKLDDSNLSLQSLADDLGYNASYLSSLIKNKLGITYQEYLTKNRIKKAKILLLTTSLKNYEIAEEVGFENVNYFSLRFKQVTGVSPREYRKRADRK